MTQAGRQGDDGPMFKVMAGIADAVTPAEVYEALVDRVADAVGASSAGLWLLETDGRSATLMRSRGYAPEARRAMQTFDIRGEPTSPAVDCIRFAAPLWIPSQAALYAQYPHLASLATPSRSYRISCLPLVAGGGVLGSLCLTIEEEGDAGEGEKDFLLLVAKYATQAIERLRLYERERRSRAAADAAADRLRVLNRASRVFAGPELDLISRLRAVTTELSQALDSCVNIGLIQPDGLLHLIAVHHPIAEANEELQRLSPAAPLRLGEGLTGKIALDGTSVLIPSPDQAELAARVAPSYRALLERFPARAMMGAPLRVGGKVIGTVTVTRHREGQTYADADLEMLEELAERAAVAIENGRLYQETLDARTRAEQLYRFADAVVAAERVEVVFEAALDSIEAALGVRRAAILTHDDRKVMRFRAWRKLSDAYRQTVEGHSPWPPDATAPQPVLVNDALNDQEWASYADLFRREKIGALAFFPLLARGRLLGKLMLYHDAPHTFTPTELGTVRAIGHHLGSVIARFAAWAELAETVRSNELFAGVLAHDLRSPLGAMMVAAQLLARQQRAEPSGGTPVTTAAGRILSSGRRMDAMISQLLDFTRTRSGGGIRIERADARLDELCAQAVGELELLHPEWQIQREAMGDLSGRWDPGRLVQVLSNVISNAGQHGPAGGRIKVTLDGTRQDHVTVAVHNRGCVPASMLPELFDPFRTTRQRQGQSSGLGLGLFIVHEIVRAHGGSVSVSSTEDVGTTVSIRLPRA